jgi:ceramide glucosyltransferase
MVIYGFLALATLLLLIRMWQHWQVMRFFRRPRPILHDEPRLVSILQPILSGDPTLAACLEQNLGTPCRFPREFLWLIDEDDVTAQGICQELIGRHPKMQVRLIVLPPPLEGCSPKMAKLAAAVPRADGDVICVLDDDTVLPAGGLEESLPYLDEPGAGLAFGLPYYLYFGNLWSSLVACFVNSHSLLTYLPPTALVEPFTINGMFYVFRPSTLEASGGLRGLVGVLADDFAVAQHFRAHGYRLVQTPMRHGIRTHVASRRAYLRLLQRWLIFPRETVLRALPLRDRAVACLTGLLPAMGPLLVPALVLLGCWQAALAFALTYGGCHFASFAYCNRAYLNRATPWRCSWQVPLIQMLLPLQLLAALVAPQRIHWRGHVMQIERGGGFHFVRRRAS